MNIKLEFLFIFLEPLLFPFPFILRLRSVPRLISPIPQRDRVDGKMVSLKALVPDRIKYFLTSASTVLYRPFIQLSSEQRVIAFNEVFFFFLADLTTKASSYGKCCTVITSPDMNAWLILVD